MGPWTIELRSDECKPKQEVNSAEAKAHEDLIQLVRYFHIPVCVILIVLNTLEEGIGRDEDQHKFGHEFPPPSGTDKVIEFGQQVSRNTPLKVELISHVYGECKK